MARVPVVSPEGKTGTVEESDLPQALAAGFTSGEKPSPTLHGLKQGFTAGLATKGGAAIDATAAMLNEWARKNVPALVPTDPTVTEARTGGVDDSLSWGDRYENAKRVNRAMDDAAARQDPNQFALMKAVGGVAPASKAIGVARGLALVGRSAGLSAIEGAADSNGQTIGDVVDDAAVRGSLGAVAALPVAFLDKIPSLRNWLASKARIEAFKQAAAGNAKSLAGRIGGAERAGQVGQFVLDEGMLSRGDMPKDILAAAMAEKAGAGKAIGQAIGESEASVHLPTLIEKIEQGPLSNALAGGSGYAPIASRLQGIVDDLKTIQGTLGDNVPAVLIHEYKVNQANLINWVADQAKARAEKQAVGAMAGEVFRATKEAGAGDALKEANRRFGLAADLEKVAKKGAEGIANREAGLSEQIGMSGGAATGAAIGGTVAGPVGAFVGAPVGGAVGGMAQNYWRKHGSGIAARAMSGGATTIDAITQKLTATPQMQGYVSLLRRAAVAGGPSAAGALHFELYEKDPTYRAAVMAGEQSK